MMAKLPEQRYQTAREIVFDVAQLRDSVVGVSSLGTQLAATGLAASPPTSSSGLTVVVPLRPRRWLKWAVAGSMVLALAAGGVLSGYIDQSKADRNEPNPGPDHGTETDPLIASRKDRERLLRAEWERYKNPGDDEERIRWGLRHAVELALVYLEDRRLEEAQQLFREMDTPSRVAAYRAFGELGQAIVLAFQDRTIDSNKLFVMALTGKKPKNNYFFLVRTNPGFGRMIARALDQNFDNNPNPNAFPATLERFRHPPTVLPRANKGKA
jgi:hypothetical protein